MQITKEVYKNLMLEKPWNDVKKIFANIEHCPIKTVCKLKIDPAEWTQFTLDYLDLAQENYEIPKEHYSDKSKILALTNNKLGRDEHNTSELNYGILGNSNQKLIELLGKENIKTLGFHPDYVLIRLLIKMPGHGVAWHIDDAGSFIKKYSELEFDKDKKCNLGQAVRWWFPVSHWEDGHAMQISNTVITHWSPGDVYDIPWGQGHASGNFGYTPQYTVSLTGIV
jgi:hypothetical protein